MPIASFVKQVGGSTGFELGDCVGGIKCLSIVLILQLVCGTAFANIPPSLADFEALQSAVSQSEEEIVSLGISLTGSRPAHCPTESVTFRNLADKIQAISESLNEASGKCYQKHSALIGEINRKAMEEKGRAPFDITPTENGALIENNPQMVINITNTQITNIQNNNALVSGLWDLAKDKDCLELLREKGKLALVAEVLTKFGAIGFFVPSSVGMIGSAAVLAAGGMLFLLDKIIRPAFKWNLRQDRKDFMALTCAFYNVRTQLFNEGFFESPSQKLSALLQPITDKKEEITQIRTRLLNDLDRWKGNYQTKLLEAFLEAHLPKVEVDLYYQIQQDLAFLATEVGSGNTPEQRLAVVSHFLRAQETYRSLLLSGGINPGIGEKTLKALQELTSLSTPDLQRLTRKTFQLGYIVAIEYFFKEILKNDLGAPSQIVNRFETSSTLFPTLENKTVNEKALFLAKNGLDRIERMEAELNQKAEIIRRLSKKTLLDGQNEGAQAEFDIYKEFSSIKSIMLGKKGWSYFRYLVGDAKSHFKVFERGFKKWRVAQADPQQKVWSCRNAMELGIEWGEANAAVDSANDFLVANNDLWGEYYPKIEKFAGVIPIGQSYIDRMTRAVKSVEKAQEFVRNPDDAIQSEISKLRSTPVTNFGLVYARVKASEGEKRLLDDYRRTMCLGTAPPAKN